MLLSTFNSVFIFKIIAIEREFPFFKFLVRISLLNWSKGFLRYTKLT